MIPKTVHISGTVDAFREALEHRLQRTGANITDEPDGADVTVSLGEGASGDTAVVPDDSQPG